MTVKQIDFDLSNINGNSYAIMAAFRRQAMREGWGDDEVTEVFEDAQSGDYTHFMEVIDKHCIQSFRSTSVERGPEVETHV